ncbi:MAG: hypothetical protein AVDCRST_MAG53-1891 [uncultured Solirubrobacteraceae bacterium]|uniref:Uncharacterized protein n=1 Tax=uncultured Solirubrobacteraceae bacterium TaxID=1162706 RepID=A0A6J4SIM8_9ACTN|nr:MAG: hypothetical protein AVDCRST_MAG53-1891 [uncultured Solirubrobacteraceae bacterium]
MATIRELERGVWLDESALVDDDRRDVEMLCHGLSNCVADLVVSLSMFEQAQVESHVRMQSRPRAGCMEEWEREGQRQRARKAELEAKAGVAWGQLDYFEKSEAIREQVRREMLREKWAREGGPDAYRHRVEFIHAQSFISTLAVLQRSLLALTKYPFEPAVALKIKKAADDFADALPGLKGVRDSVAHVEERVRAEAHGKKIKKQPVSNSMIHAPGGGTMVVSALNNRHYGGTIADGTYAEVEVADPTTEVARAAVQAVYSAVPWRPGHRHFEPSS